jgi:hyaluronan synthase
VLPDAVGGVSTTTALATRAAVRHAAATTVVKKTPKRIQRHRLNPLAAIPYLIGFTILALEAMFLV